MRKQVDSLAYKQKVKKSFNQASYYYNDAAKLQKYAAEKLFLFPNMNFSDKKCIVDLGSGTGFISDILIKQGIDSSNIISMDIAEKMLLQNKVSSKSLCADADYIPLKDHSADIVLSNLTLQWMPDLKKTFHEIHRILKRNGLFIFSTLGENTLCELRDCWKKIDSYTHVNSFFSAKIISQLLNSSGFDICQYRLDNITQHYQSISSLMINLKKTGAHNININAPKGLSGKNKFNQLKYCYEQYRTPEKFLSASYELIYFKGRKK